MAFFRLMLLIAGLAFFATPEASYAQCTSASFPAHTGCGNASGVTGPPSPKTLSQIIGTEPANTVWAGPTTGADANPAFRALVPADLPGTFSGFSNPTATVGLSAVNGSATTAMRSDASPALSSSVQSALTGTNHAFMVGTGAFGVGSVGPCTTKQPVVGAGASADPTCATAGIRLPAGSTTVPSIGFDGTADTGIWSPAQDWVGLYAHANGASGFVVYWPGGIAQDPVSGPYENWGSIRNITNTINDGRQWPNCAFMGSAGRIMCNQMYIQATDNPAQAYFFLGCSPWIGVDGALNNDLRYTQTGVCNSDQVIMRQPAQMVGMGILRQVNGDFDSAANWTTGTDISIGAGVATKVPGASASDLTQTPSAGPVAGTKYAAMATVTCTAGTITPILDGGTTVQSRAYPCPMTASIISGHLLAVTGNNIWGFRFSADFNGSIDTARFAKIVVNRETPGATTVPLVGRAGELDIQSLGIQTEANRGGRWLFNVTKQEDPWGVVDPDNSAYMGFAAKLENTREWFFLGDGCNAVPSTCPYSTDTATRGTLTAVATATRPFLSAQNWVGAGTTLNGFNFYTTGTEYKISALNAGVETDALKINQTSGNLSVLKDATFSSFVAVGAGSILGWTNRSRFTSPSDGVISLLDNAQTSFARLTFGPADVSHAAIKNSGTTLAVRLGDDSAAAGMTLSTLSASGQITSTLGIGTAPFVVTSTTLVPNLYVARAALSDSTTTNANLTGDVTSVGNATTLVTAQPAVHTWALAQTFTVAPVFSDQAGTRTALSLGTAATQNTGTSGTTVPLLDGSNTWSNTQAFAAVTASGTVTINTNAASTTPVLAIVQANASGDASMRFSSTGQNWAIGDDRSTSDAFKISAAAALGTSDVATFSTAGALTMTTSVTATTFLKSGVVAVGSLPTCNAGAEGTRYGVNDSNAVSFTAGIGAIVAAGGSTHVPVYCDGTNWRIG